MKNENYITIQGWMINKLGLSGNELLCYALIYGFSQDGESCFCGSRKYIAELIGAKSLNTVDKYLDILIGKQLIEKRSRVNNGVISNYYKANLENQCFLGCTPTSKNEYPLSKNEHNNINIDKVKEKEIDKSISKKKGGNAFNIREDLSYVKEEYADIWNEWLDYKDEIKKQYKTQRGAKSQYNSLVKYANNNPILANAIVKQSIERSWDGLFALTDKQVELFLSQKSPYSVDNNNEQLITQQTSEQVIIGGQIYR